MTTLDELTDAFIDAKDPYLSVTPGWTSLIRHSATARAVGLTMQARGLIKAIRKGETTEQIVANMISGKITEKLSKPAKNASTQAHIWASHHSGDHLVYENGKIEKLGEHVDAKGVDQRSWIDTPGQYRMVVIYHDADRAGPHLDVHIGAFSVIYRVKPDLYEQIRFNHKGELTQNSKELLMAHVRAEVANGSRVPQNLDHPDAQATYSWYVPEDGPVGYGAGATRQVVSDSKVEVYKAGPQAPIELFSPAINPDKSLYIHKLYPGDENRVPILVWGERVSRPPALEDKLHLKMLAPQNLDAKAPKLDMTTSTHKYDGASCYVVITPKGTRVYSPRTSKVSGEQIEYTRQLNGLATVTSDQTIVAMGEVVLTRRVRGRQRYVSAAEVGGVLNSHGFVPDDLTPEIRLYRVDRIGRKKTRDLPFWENRALQEEIASLDPDHLKVVELISPAEAKRRGYEGVVIAPPGGSVNQAVKVKYVQDPADWRIDQVNFYPGERGGLAGVVYCTDLESGKQFKLGPGQVGNREVTEHMMANPQLYEGTVIKVTSRRGHAGRAAKAVEGWHLDKGTAPV